jgi:hypothetical protein
MMVAAYLFRHLHRHLRRMHSTDKRKECRQPETTSAHDTAFFKAPAELFRYAFAANPPPPASLFYMTFGESRPYNRLRAGGRVQSEKNTLMSSVIAE